MSYRKFKITKKNAHKVLADIEDQIVKGHKESSKQFCDAINEMLDTLLGEDFFGTEGQCDPRGDHRGEND